MTQVKKALKAIFFCVWCYTTREQTWERDGATQEVYRCDTCHNLNYVTVR